MLASGGTERLAGCWRPSGACLLPYEVAQPVLLSVSVRVVVFPEHIAVMVAVALVADTILPVIVNFGVP